MSQTCLGAPSCHDAPGPGVSALETSLVLPLSVLQTCPCGLGAAHVLEPPTGMEQSQATRVLLMVMEPPRVLLMMMEPPCVNESSQWPLMVHLIASFQY